MESGGLLPLLPAFLRGQEVFHEEPRFAAAAAAAAAAAVQMGIFPWPPLIAAF